MNKARYRFCVTGLAPRFGKAVMCGAMDQLRGHDPRTVGPYRVLGRLGAGGMGQVFLAADRAGRKIALKVVHHELATDPGFRERFRREARMAASAPAWFTAPVLGADPGAERPWLATAFVEGPSLQAHVDEHGPLRDDEIAWIAERMAAGLAAMHAGGLVHRDLKPANVLMGPDGPRLIDFGIARAVDATTMTRTGHLLGTPSFMSPEQVAGSRDVGPASDVFALGAVVAFAATGRSPFAADSTAGSLYRVAQAKPDLDGLSGRTRDIVQACLVRDPQSRPTAAALRDTIRDGVAPDRRPRRKAWPVVVAAVTAVAAVAAAVLLLGGTGSGDVPSDVSSDRAPVDAAVDPRFGTGPARFVTPSGNITCEMSTTGTRCDVDQRAWQVPARPAVCSGRWATGTVVAAGKGELSCVDGPFDGPGPAVLGYGESIELAGVVCASRETGVRCENRATLHGFSISRTAYELF